MSDDSTQARRTLYLWALGLNVVAWGGYLVLTKVMGIDFESIRQARSPKIGWNPDSPGTNPRDFLDPQAIRELDQTLRICQALVWFGIAVLGVSLYKFISAFWQWR